MRLSTSSASVSRSHDNGLIVMTGRGPTAAPGEVSHKNVSNNDDNPAPAPTPHHHYTCTEEGTLKYLHFRVKMFWSVARRREIETPRLLLPIGRGAV